MLTSSIIVLIMSNAINNRRDFTILYTRISIFILVFCFFLTENTLYYDYINKGIVIFNGLLCIENFAIFITLFIYLLTIIILSICSVFFYKKKNNFFKNIILLVNKKNFQFNWKDRIFLYTMSEHYRIIEYPLLILFCITGAIFLIYSSDLITIFLSIELQSYALYLICSIYRNSESSTKAGLTYFLLGGLSSCIILLGLSFIYINSGSTNLDNIYIVNNISDIYSYNILYNTIEYNNSIINIILTSDIQHVYMQIGLLIMSIGFLFKISAAPFHFWSPDVYDAVPTITTTFIAIIPKISILILLYKLLYYTSSDTIVISWINNLMLSSILSLIIGSVLGLTQYRIKRLYAYSTISHVGFLLIGLSINNIESIKAFFFYLLQYSISNLNAFIILIIIGYTLNNYVNNTEYKDINYSPVKYIYQLKGFFYINPILTISFIITLFSFAGIPPLIGFFAKQMILISAINTGLFLIVFIAILTSVISTVYYLAIIKIMCFEYNSNTYKNKFIYQNNYYISSFYSFNVSIFTLLIMSFIFFDQEILNTLNIIIN